MWPFHMWNYETCIGRPIKMTPFLVNHELSLMFSKLVDLVLVSLSCVVYQDMIDPMFVTLSSTMNMSVLLYGNAG